MQCAVSITNYGIPRLFKALFSILIKGLACGEVVAGDMGMNHTTHPCLVQVIVNSAIEDASGRLDFHLRCPEDQSKLPDSTAAASLAEASAHPWPIPMPTQYDCTKH
jgi:hypothetical protein